MTALAYEQFELPWAPALALLGSPRSMIERVPSDPRLARKLQEYRRLARDGWAVSALLAPDSKTVVLIACKAGAPVAAEAPNATSPAPSANEGNQCDAREP